MRPWKRAVRSGERTTARDAEPANPGGSLHDDDLLARIADGEEEYFTPLYDRYRLPIYRFCRFMLSEQTAAEDVFQETFVGLLSAVRRGETIRNVEAYLLTIARRRALNHLRDARPLLRLDDPAVSVPVAAPRRTDLEEQLSNALSALPVQYREAFLLFAVQGYSYREIAEHIGVTTAVVQNRVFRARQGLQKIIGPDIGVERGDRTSTDSKNRE